MDFANQESMVSMPQKFFQTMIGTNPPTWYLKLNAIMDELLWKIIKN